MMPEEASGGSQRRLKVADDADSRTRFFTNNSTNLSKC